MSNVKDKVRIELPKPRDAAHAEQVCAMANRMMTRLGDTAGKEFFWDDREGCYCWGGDMGSQTMPGRGIWFNLAYLGREGT